MDKAKIPSKILDYNNNQLRTHIEKDLFKKYHQQSKPLQVKAVLNLIRGRHMFLLAATGFGKSRIPEMYLNMKTKDQNVVLHIWIMRVCSGIDLWV
jgi:superfamily II helicase